MENIPQVSGNRDNSGQNYDGRKEVSATLSLLKRNIAPLYFKIEKLAETGLRAS